MISVSPNALVALAAAATWGGGDFSGGMAAKAAGNSLRGALRVIVVAHVYSLLALTLIVLVQGNSLPTGAPLAWALGAGVAAGFSLAAFYLALARGTMGASAAISGLLAAGIPVVVSWFLEGAPTWFQGLGFLLAAVSIWFIAAAGGAAKGGDSGEQTTALAVAGGVGFGLYFVALQRANGLGTFEPLMLARVGSIATCLAMLVVTANRSKASNPPPLSRSAKRWTLAIAVLDTAGNLLFITATRWGRLDAAAVLASLYPASTILLAAWLLRERPRGRQILGMMMALGAVVLITI